mmetsp:Transcript_20222/g.56065  ORF Transcript_20222/g.56065 Transcript_20222/m.56065 type:complete len:212 (+) Transcript_20222:497-1132(+)
MRHKRSRSASARDERCRRRGWEHLTCGPLRTLRLAEKVPWVRVASEPQWCPAAWNPLMASARLPSPALSPPSSRSWACRRISLATLVEAPTARRSSLCGCRHWGQARPLSTVSATAFHWPRRGRVRGWGPGPNRKRHLGTRFRRSLCRSGLCRSLPRPRRDSAQSRCPRRSYCLQDRCRIGAEVLVWHVGARRRLQRHSRSAMHRGRGRRP